MGRKCLVFLPLGQASGEGAVSPPKKFFLFFVLKWYILVHSDTLRIIIVPVTTGSKDVFLCT